MRIISATKVGQILQRYQRVLSRKRDARQIQIIKSRVIKCQGKEVFLSYC